MKLWKHLFLALAFLTVASSIGLFGVFIFADRKVIGYYLESYQLHQNSSDHELRICCERDWAIDTYITLDRNVSYQEAIQITKEMNDKLNRRR